MRVHIVPKEGDDVHKKAIDEDCFSRHHSGQPYVRIQVEAKSNQQRSSVGQVVAPRWSDEMTRKETIDARGNGGPHPVVATWSELEESRSAELPSAENRCR